MTKRKKNGRRRPSRLDRIERKIDRILTEIILIRQRDSHPLDEAIERMHRVARMMRAQCEREYEDLIKTTDRP